jgi:cytochrome c-type biogenesis protein
VTLLSFAFGAGILATVNPCGFAMLPAFLAFYLGEDDAGGGGRAGRLSNGLAVGGAVSTGFAGVFTAAGLVVAAGLRSIIGYVPWVAVVIGAALVVVGLAMVAGRHVGVRLGERFRPGQDRSYRRMVVFGAAYATASLSCTLAVLLAVIAQGLATHNPLQMVGVFVAYGAGSATVLTALAISAAGAKAGLARGLRRLLPVASRLAGGILVLSGAYLVSYWLPALTSGSGRGRAAVGLPDHLSASLSTIFDRHRGLFALVALVLAVTATVAAVRARSPRFPGPAQDEETDACCARVAEQAYVEVDR